MTEEEIEKETAAGITDAVQVMRSLKTNKQGREIRSNGSKYGMGQVMESLVGELVQREGVVTGK